MHPINSLSDAIRVVHFFIAEERGWQDVKKRKSMVCWRDESRGMVGPRRIWITEYAKDIYRISGGLTQEFIKSAWPFKVPRQAHFKLTLHASEITREFIRELLPFVSASFDDFNEVPSISQYKTREGFPSHAWTTEEEEVYNVQRRQGKAGR